MQGFPAAWHLAGGWAIDLFLRTQRREHKDWDIAIARQDQLALQEHFSDRQLLKVIEGKTSPWPKGEFLHAPLFQVFAGLDEAAMPTLEFLLEDYEGDHWIYRRDPRITLSIERAHLVTPDGLPFLAPEIVLLFKAKHVVSTTDEHPQSNDELDFQDCHRQMGQPQKDWLADAISRKYPDHPWLPQLASA
jgi:hypothetical protein